MRCRASHSFRPLTSEPNPGLLPTFVLQSRIVLEPAEEFLCVLDGTKGGAAFNGSEVAGRDAVKC